MADPPLLWTEPVWLERALAWIDGELDRLGRPRTGPAEQPHARPWATALRVPTADGDVWFKAGVPAVAHEVRVVPVLERRCPGVLPALLASDADAGWMLLEDAGERLRELIGGDREKLVRCWDAVLPVYAELQLATVPDRDDLLAAGMPDFRLATIPERYGALLADEAMLRAGAYALDDDAIGSLCALAPRIADICAELDALGFPETVQHDDLHDGQIFVRDGRYRILDWGDACIAHPFMTLTVTLNSIADTLDSEDRGLPEVVRARDAYLDAWPGPRADRLRAFELADLLGHVSRAQTWKLVAVGMPEPHRTEYGSRVPAWLGELLSVSRDAE